MSTQQSPNLESLLRNIGEAGRRMSDIEACEGAAGNISVCVRGELDIKALFPCEEMIDLPQPVPELEGGVLIVSGSGRRLREIAESPLENLACLVVEPGGRTARQCSGRNNPFGKVTSEFNSHLAVHYDRLLASGASFHAIIHAQPPNLTYLSHIPRYQDAHYLNQRLLRWQPEAILNFPNGIGLASFIVPGSDELAVVNAALFRQHSLVVWAKHGVMACSQVSVMHAGDLIEYAETGARYEYMNLVAGEIAAGLSPEEIRAMCASKNIQQSVY